MGININDVRKLQADSSGESLTLVLFKAILCKPLLNYSGSITITFSKWPSWTPFGHVLIYLSLLIPLRSTLCAHCSISLEICDLWSLHQITLLFPPLPNHMHSLQERQGARGRQRSLELSWGFLYLTSVSPSPLFTWNTLLTHVLKPNIYIYLPICFLFIALPLMYF